MGKGGANPYPLWWATGTKPVINEVPSKLDPIYEGIPSGFFPKDMRYEWEKYESEQNERPNFRKFFSFFDEDPFTNNRGKRSHPRDFFEEEECEYQENNDPFEILGVSENADPKEIKKAYYNLCKIHHPDKGGNKQDFIKIQSAWEYIEMYYL